MTIKKHSFTDPYSKNMHRFFNEIAERDPQQGLFLAEYTFFPELQTFLKPKSAPNGDFLGFDIDDKDKEAYQEKKRQLNVFTPENFL